MFTDLVLNYYYSNISINTTTRFNKVCKLIQSYFEGAEYKKNILFKQNITIPKSIIEKNKKKLIEKYLQLLI